MTMHCRVSKFRFAQSETIPRRVQGAKFKICEQETGRDAATSPDGEAENEQSQKLMKRAKGQCNRLFSRPSTGWSARDSKPSQERVEQSGARAKRSREGKEGAKDEESDQDTETRQDCAKPLRTTRQQVGPSQRRDKRRGTWGAGRGKGHGNERRRPDRSWRKPGGGKGPSRSVSDRPLERSGSRRAIRTDGNYTYLGENLGGGVPRKVSWWSEEERATGEGGHRADRKKSAHAPATSPSTPERQVGIQTSEERGREKHGVGEGRPISFEWVLATLLTMSCFLPFHLTMPFRTQPPRVRAE